MKVNTDRVGNLVIGVVNDEGVLFEKEVERLLRPAVEKGKVIGHGFFSAEKKVSFRYVKYEWVTKGGIIERLDWIVGA